MAIANALRGRAVPVPAPPPTPEGPPLGGAGPLPHRIGVTREEQKGDNWCWAAVAVTIRNFQTPLLPAMTQCELAARQFVNIPCRTAKPPCGCDDPSFLEVALQNAGVLATNSKGKLLLADLWPRLRDDKPVCCAIQFPWRNHFIQIDGFNLGGLRGNELLINDPYFPDRSTTYETLERGHYHGDGTWIWTYLVS